LRLSRSRSSWRHARCPSGTCRRFRWAVRAGRRRSIPFPASARRAYLQFANGYVSGSGGCNRISGTYHLDSVGAGAIVFSRLAGTKVMCPPEIQAGENQMLLVMQGTSSFSIKGALGNELTLSGSAGTMLFIADRPELKQDPAAK
jgi:heat shock protein HslJ